MEDLDSVLNGSKDSAPQEVEHEVVQEQSLEAESVEPKGEAEALEVAEHAEGETPSSDHGKHVPLSALEAVRREKTDWKEKAIRYEEQLKAIQNKPAQETQKSNVDFSQMSEQDRNYLEAFNQRAEISEMIARQKYGDEAVDQAHQVFSEAVQKNPALQQAMLQQQNPWDYVYREGTKLLALKEIGEDPKAYRERIREEIRQELLQSQTSQPSPSAAASGLPPSLASARSSAPRSSVAFTGPTPLDSILKRG